MKVRRLGIVLFVTLLLATAPGVWADTISPERLVAPGVGIGLIKVGMLLKDRSATRIRDKG